MWKDIFTKQQELLTYFFEHLDTAQAEQVVQRCLATKGWIVITGVGKSGIIAEKIAMTLVSTGTRAIYLPALNFLHGDIGAIGAEDLVILLSKSGETEELVDLLPHLRKRGAQTCALVCNAQSRLAQMAHFYCVLPVQKELCPFDLAPTISTEVQLLFGDALAIELMQQRGFSLSAYSDNHPAGTIGKKVTLKVSDIMLHGQAVPTCYTTDRLSAVLSELSDKKCGCLIVVDKEQTMQGIFTDGDLRRSLQTQNLQVLESKLEELMTRSAIAISKDALAWDAMKLMQKDPKRWIMVLPVLENGKLVGLLRMHDIIHAGIA